LSTTKSRISHHNSHHRSTTNGSIDMDMPVPLIAKSKILALQLYWFEGIIFATK